MADEEPGQPRGENPWYAFARYAGLGFEVAIVIVLSLYIGSRLDTRFDTSPLFLIVSLIIGFAVAISILVKYSRMAGQDMKKGDDEGGNGAKQ